MGVRDPRAVREMFDRISPRYDLVNTVLSGGTDGGWRRKAAAATGLAAGGSALDVACGSGKLTAVLARRAEPGGRVVGLDFSGEMLRRARLDHPRIPFVRGDALALPYPDATFDGTTIAFGLRNLADPVKGLAEMLRVIRPGGRAVVLEFVKPRENFVGGVYRTYLRHVLPRVGGVISGDRAAYQYLSDTVDSYHTPAELVGLAGRAGWQDVTFRSLAFGSVGVVSGRR